MRHIKLLHIKNEADNVDFDYRKQIDLIVKAPIGAQGGVSVGEMREAFKILDKLDALKDKPNHSLVLEDAEWEFLRNRVQQWPWPYAHKVFLQFVEAIEKAPTSEPRSL